MAGDGNAPPLVADVGVTILLVKSLLLPPGGRGGILKRAETTFSLLSQRGTLMFRAIRVLALGVVMASWGEMIADGEGVGKSEPAKLTAALPRYQLEIGQQLDYETSSSQKYQSGELKSAADWRIWVVSANQQGGWRLLVKQTMWNASGDRPLTKDAGAAQPELA
ncbi:MAG TPA: hypothetical protein VHC19_07160, partial [Pirellulales bacterium]|nr:hypothetical protein [Pirellulales bacterium]